MKRVFLYGDVADNFEANSAWFVEAAGARDARIALLLMGGPNWERYVARYRDPWTLIAALRVEGVSVSVILGPESHLLDTARRVLQAPREDYDLKFASYGHAAVLYDPKNLWPGVKAAIQVAQKKLAMGTEI